MNKGLFYLPFMILCTATMLFATPAHAQIKDSYYFMADDGEQSQEEMEEEAEYVFQTCDNNTYQKNYFDCQCVAGAFLQQREKVGGVVPQEEILSNITRTNKAQCANTIEIAGEAYEDCQRYVSMFREYEKDNEEYCSCVGNTVAKRFSKAPYLRTTYIRKIRTDAIVECKNRDTKGNPLPGQK
jgi:hypothetical protein